MYPSGSWSYKLTKLQVSRLRLGLFGSSIETIQALLYRSGFGCRSRTIYNELCYKITTSQVLVVSVGLVTLKRPRNCWMRLTEVPCNTTLRYTCSKHVSCLISESLLQPWLCYFQSNMSRVLIWLTLRKLKIGSFHISLFVCRKGVSVYIYSHRP